MRKCDTARMFEVKLTSIASMIRFLRCFRSSGLRRSIKCIYHAFNARRYVQEHRIVLEQAAHHGGIGVGLPDESKSGIPHGCGFELPIHSIMFMIGLIGLLYTTHFYEQNTI